VISYQLIIDPERFNLRLHYRNEQMIVNLLVLKTKYRYIGQPLTVVDIVMQTLMLMPLTRSLARDC